MKTLLIQTLLLSIVFCTCVLVSHFKAGGAKEMSGRRNFLPSSCGYLYSWFGFNFQLFLDSYLYYRIDSKIIQTKTEACSLKAWSLNRIVKLGGIRKEISKKPIEDTFSFVALTMESWAN